MPGEVVRTFDTPAVDEDAGRGDAVREEEQDGFVALNRVLRAEVHLPAPVVPCYTICHSPRMTYVSGKSRRIGCPYTRVSDCQIQAYPVVEYGRG